MLRGFVGALIGGLIGAAVWAAIGYFAGYELGIIAWGIGALSGLGVMCAIGDERDAGTGALAAVVAIAAIVAGKYGVAYLVVEREAAAARESIVSVSMDDAKLALADEVVEEYEEAGKPVKWPEGMTFDDADEPADYPPDLWKDAEARWAAMTPDEQEDYRLGVVERREEIYQSFRAEARKQAFSGSFAIWDALWVGLALLSALKIGSGYNS